MRLTRTLRRCTIAASGVLALIVCGLWIAAIFIGQSRGWYYDVSTRPTAAPGADPRVAYPLSYKESWGRFTSSRLRLVASIKDERLDPETFFEPPDRWPRYLQDTRAHRRTYFGLRDGRNQLTITRTTSLRMSRPTIVNGRQIMVGPVQHNDATITINLPWFILLTLVSLPWLLHLPFAARRWYRRLQPKPGHCPKCNYDLAGLASSAMCPECGASRKSCMEGIS